MTDSRLFPASQIARATGFSLQAVANGLERIPARGQVKSDGRNLDAWAFSDLPIDWQLEITRRGFRRKFSSGEDYLAKAAIPWQPTIGWAEIPETHRAKAEKLQKAMARCLRLRGSGMQPGQIEAAGLEDFKSEFGYTIHARHWRRLFTRTLDRDGGRENWSSPEIYLDDRAFAKPRPTPELRRSAHLHQPLEDTVASLENQRAPTLQDRQFLWASVFSHYESLTASLGCGPEGNRERRRIKASLLGYLLQAFPGGILAGSEKALRNRFDEKIKLWRASGGDSAAIIDKRPIGSGNFRRPEFKEDLAKIRNLAILLDGSESLAHRMLREQGELSQEFCDYYAFNPRKSKSTVPRSIRDDVTAEVNMTGPLRRGPWNARMRGPWIQRDWSAVHPGDWFCADDVTWNHYFRDQLPDGSWKLLRGECLLMTDLRTGYPLDFLLIAGHYNGEHVRSLALKVHDNIGLPRSGYYFERGVWRSRLVVGDNRQGTPVHWREAENGLCSAELKLEVKHATTPRAKPIEGALRILQERMRCIPGFIGFNERTDEREREQELIARANGGDKTALMQFPTQSGWAENISRVLEEFSRDPQNGEMLQGASPAEAWVRELRQRPLRKLPLESRYILSTHRKEVTVRQEGIVLTIRGKTRLYYNAQTGSLIGQRVLAFYNLEMPALLTVSDMKRQNFFAVESKSLPAMGASREEIAEVNGLRNAHMAPAKAIFSQIRHTLKSTIVRDNEQREAGDLGSFHMAAMAQAKAAGAERARKMGKARRLAGTEGIPVSPNVRNPDRVLDGIEMIKAYRDRLKAKESEIENHSGGMHE